jgi:hypothetical protein
MRRINGMKKGDILPKVRQQCAVCGKFEVCL